MRSVSTWPSNTDHFEQRYNDAMLIGVAQAFAEYVLFHVDVIDVDLEKLKMSRK